MRNQPEETAMSTAKYTPHIRAILLLAGILLLVLGLFQGGAADVRNKAIRICYECIGIG